MAAPRNALAPALAVVLLAGGAAAAEPAEETRRCAALVPPGPVGGADAGTTALGAGTAARAPDPGPTALGAGTEAGDADAGTTALGAGTAAGDADAGTTAPGAGTAAGEPDAGEAPFGPPAALSDPAAAALMPALAVRGGRVLIAWQESDGVETRLRYALAEDGCVGATRAVDDPLGRPRRPAVAATGAGFVLAYEARATPDPVVRVVDLDPDGRPLAPPRTLSAPGRVGSRVRVAARGDDVVFAWTDVHDHWIARRGPVETLPPTPVGTLIVDPGLINFPRVALGERGAVYLAYRDGGPEYTDYEILLVTRTPGGEFGRPINVSRSKGRMSDDVALAIEADGRLRLLWVEQDPDKPREFRLAHAAFDPATGIGEPAAFAIDGLSSFRPSLAPGLAAAWHSGSVRSGKLYFVHGAARPAHVLPEMRGAMVALAGDPATALHLVFIEASDPPRLRYAWRRGGG